MSTRLACAGSAAVVGAMCGLLSFASTRAEGVRPAVVIKGDREFGQYLSAECVTCHQVSGRFDGIPPIIGWPENVFVEIMGEYKTHKRENAVMRTLAERLNDEEIAALAAYFASLTEPTKP